MKNLFNNKNTAEDKVLPLIMHMAVYIIDYSKQKVRLYREFFFWLVVAMIPSFDFIFSSVQRRTISYQAMIEHQMSISLSLAIFIIPVVYTFIYGIAPLEKLKQNTKNKESGFTDERRLMGSEKNHDRVGDEEKDPIYYVEELVINSTKLANDIYGRASLYLFIGVIMSLLGLLFFYFNTGSYNFDIKNINVLLLTLLPKFGVLFFLELVAFFFLKQYRISMDEFRYYETLKRSREETLAIVKIMKSSNVDFHVYDLIEKCGFRSTVDKLDAGQTTDLIESRKLSKDDYAIFEKMLDTLAQLKK